ncbi:MAG: hypothetical protein HY609_05260 [Deltaproteobacteria bacterium]|nr:hypothetical protein [Deltaproteobacteria bacterium]MBI4224321.1 hypothetical protein [Deltaproteobacteria bacterium]
MRSNINGLRTTDYGLRTGRGSAVTEFILILPLLILVLWGFQTVFQKGHGKQKAIIQEQAPLWKNLLK